MKQQNWSIVLHDALQHIPDFLFLRERVFPDVIPEGKNYNKPHIVWYETGNIQTSAVDGQFETGIRVSIDFRSQTRFQCDDMRYRIIGFLKTIGIVERVVNVSNLYDFDTKIRRAIVDVVIPPFINPQSNPYTRFSPWGPQFGNQFG